MRISVAESRSQNTHIHTVLVYFHAFRFICRCVELTEQKRTRISILDIHHSATNEFSVNIRHKHACDRIQLWMCVVATVGDSTGLRRCANQCVLSTCVLSVSFHPIFIYLRSHCCGQRKYYHCLCTHCVRYTNTRAKHHQSVREHHFDYTARGNKLVLYLCARPIQVSCSVFSSAQSS